MKYIGIENADSEKLVMHIACKECDAELTGLEKFCPQCGRKLDKKEKGIPLMKAVELLDPLRSEATMKNTLPTYTGLKDFARGVQKLYKLHGNIPVFIGVAGEDEVAPFGMAIQQTSLLGGDAIIFKAGTMKSPGSFQKGKVTS